MRKFSAPHHFPRYTKLLVESLLTPAIVFFVLFGNILLAVFTFAFYLVESQTNPQVHGFFDAIWWGITTITTVGYGDIVPLTASGRICGILLMISGVSFFVGFSAILFTTFMKLENEKLQAEEMLNMEDGNQKINAKLDEILHKLNNT